jgi:hypothetical protein
VRLPAHNKQRIADIVAPYQNSMSLELQQRGSEFSMLLTDRWDRLRGDLLGKMPILDEAAMRRRKEADGASEPSSSVGAVNLVSGAAFAGAGTSSSIGFASKSEPSLLDLDDIFGGAPAANNLSSPTLSQQPVASIFNSIPSANGGNNAAPATAPDLLADLFTLKASVSPNPQQSVSSSFPSSASQSANILVAANPSVQVFDNGVLQIVMELSKPNVATPANTRVICKFSNKGPSPITDFNFQVRLSPS